MRHEINVILFVLICYAKQYTATKIITTIGAANGDESEVVNKVVRAVRSGYYGVGVVVGVVKLDEGDVRR